MNQPASNDTAATREVGTPQGEHRQGEGPSEEFRERIAQEFEAEVLSVLEQATGQRFPSPPSRIAHREAMTALRGMTVRLASQADAIKGSAARVEKLETDLDNTGAALVDALALVELLMRLPALRAKAEPFGLPF